MLDVPAFEQLTPSSARAQADVVSELEAQGFSPDDDYGFVVRLDRGFLQFVSEQEVFRASLPHADQARTLMAVGDWANTRAHSGLARYGHYRGSSAARDRYYSLEGRARGQDSGRKC